MVTGSYKENVCSHTLQVTHMQPALICNTMILSSNEVAKAYQSGTVTSSYNVLL